MICPIRELTHLMYEIRPGGLVIGPEVKTPECCKELCAWWSGTKNMCCIQLLDEENQKTPKMLND